MNFNSHARPTSGGLSLRVSDIADAASRIAGRVSVVTNIGKVVDDLADAVRTGPALRAITQPDPTRRRGRTLARPLSEEFSLRPEDGCRVDTLAEALPVALERARRGNASVLRDQAGRSVLELVDFRIQLATPRIERIPTYLKNDSDLLEAYFQREFCEPNGLFRKQLDIGNQLAIVTDHVATSVAEGEFNTRRAILVVPHTPDGRHPAPLGLVSVRLLPREIGPRTKVDASFTWRTVEALVGLPYSLYGSISFAEYLIRMVNTRIESRRTLELGELSYIAHSLHLFADEHSLAIAKQIIDVASD